MQAQQLRLTRRHGRDPDADVTEGLLDMLVKGLAVLGQAQGASVPVEQKGAE